MGRSVAIVQSNYIPWKGYFDLIRAADEFILLDDVQYTRRDWRNRNRIKTEHGTRWLTIPVQVSGKYHQRIDETRVSDPNWASHHFSQIQQAYRTSEAWNMFADQLSQQYARASELQRLTEVNELFLRWICDALQIDTPISRSTDYDLVPGKTERLLNLCLQAQATEYISGPAARPYLDIDLFASHDIKVTFADYEGYPEYTQLHGPFEHNVTVLDLLLNAGMAATNHMRLPVPA